MISIKYLVSYVNFTLDSLKKIKTVFRIRVVACVDD